MIVTFAKDDAAKAAYKDVQKNQVKKIHFDNVFNGLTFVVSPNDHKFE